MEASVPYWLERNGSEFERFVKLIDSIAYLFLRSSPPTYPPLLVNSDALFPALSHSFS